MNVLIVRHAYLPDVTLGSLYVGTLKLATLEESWAASPFGPGGQRRDATHKESCVPDGAYQLVYHNTQKHPDCWALVNTDLGVWSDSLPPGLPYGRTAILIHSGNTTADTEGCVLVGLRHARLDGQPSVLESRAALDQLRARLGTSNHSLEIRPIAGTSEMNHG